MTSFALLLHEFFTNATKYGALSAPQGYVDIVCSDESDLFVLRWTEHGGPGGESQGFGTILGRPTVARQLGGEITRDWDPNGMRIRVSRFLESGSWGDWPRDSLSEPGSK